MKIYFILFENFFINNQKLKANVTKISVKNLQLQIWKYDLISLRAGLFSAQNFPFQEVNSMKCHQEKGVCTIWTDNWKQEESSIKRKKILLKACATIGTPQNSTA